MTLKSLKTFFKNSLLDYYQETEIGSFFDILTRHVLGKNRVEVALSLDVEVSKTDIEKFNDAIERLKNHEPIQYITGETEFYGLPFKVNPSVLIPRPETEELVKWIINDLPKNRQTASQSLNILDIGTGSACIAVSIAKNLTNSKVFALDISAEALNVAQTNAKQNDVNIDFIQTDILNCNLEFENLKFDIIVSNPPYVRDQEKHLIKENVLNHEPHLALFVKDDDPLLFYRKIIQLAATILKPKGQLYFEINEYLGEEMVKLFNAEGFKNVELKQDIFNKNRMVKAALV